MCVGEFTQLITSRATLRKGQMLHEEGTPQALYLAEKLLAIDGFYGRRVISF